MTMIIKSKAWKSKYHDNLSQYMLKNCARSKNGNPLALVHWIHAKPTERRKIVRAFLENAKPLKKRKNWNYLHHEVISLPKNLPVSKSKQVAILYHLMGEYIQKRANLHLAFWVVHLDKEHPHAHIMISSNEIWARKNSSDRHRFNRNRRELEHYQITRFPELWEEYIYDKRRKRRKIEIENKLNILEQKMVVSDISRKQKWENSINISSSETRREANLSRVRKITEKALSVSYSLDDLQKNLKKHNLEYYASICASWIIDLNLKKEWLSKNQYSFRFSKMPELATDLANVLTYDCEKKSRLRELRRIRRKCKEKNRAKAR